MSKLFDIAAITAVAIAILLAGAWLGYAAHTALKLMGVI
jgi:hypothetical protein